jgi:hypothetical protein
VEKGLGMKLVLLVLIFATVAAADWWQNANVRQFEVKLK